MSAEQSGMKLDLEFNNALPDTPNPNEILSLKMLKDVNANVFQPMYEDQVSYLTQARALLMADPWLQTKMGGTGLESCSRLAKILKARSNELHLQDRIDGLVKATNKEQFGTVAHENLKPVVNTENGVKTIWTEGKGFKQSHMVGQGACIKISEKE